MTILTNKKKSSPENDHVQGLEKAFRKPAELLL